MSNPKKRSRDTDETREITVEDAIMALGSDKVKEAFRREILGINTPLPEKQSPVKDKIQTAWHASVIENVDDYKVRADGWWRRLNEFYECEEDATENAREAILRAIEEWNEEVFGDDLDPVLTGCKRGEGIIWSKLHALSFDELLVKLKEHPGIASGEFIPYRLAVSVTKKPIR